MRKLIVLSFVALAVGSGVATSSAQAKMHFLPHKKGLTTKERVAYFARSAEHEKGVASWLAMVRHNLLAKRSLSASESLPKVNRELHWHREAFHWHKNLLRHYRAKLAPPLPLHHALWMCLLPHEGGTWSNQNTGGNGHWGGLQMHPGWGYGTSYHASDDSQFVQERAAEKGYSASGYSRSYLIQQWGQTIGYCWNYA